MADEIINNNSYWKGLGLGGLGIGGLATLFPGQEAQQGQMSTLNPQQQQYQSQLLSVLGPNVMKGLQQGNNFAPIEQQARQGFKQKTIPSIMERFAASNSLESSALPQELGGAGAEFETGLGALRSQHGFQEQSQLMQLLGMLMQPTVENTYQQRQPGFLEAGSPAILKYLIKLLPLML